MTIRDVIFKSHYRRTGFTKKNSYYSVKHQKKKRFVIDSNQINTKIPDASNAKNFYKSL